MKRARLATLLALSLLLHLAVIGWIVHGAAPVRSAVQAPPAPLALRLEPAPAPARSAAPAATPAAPKPVATRPVKQAPGMAAAAAPVPQPAPAATAALPVLAEPDPNAPVQMPGRYRVRFPASVTLTYSMAGGTAATIAWDVKDDAWTIHSSGVTGKLSSQGKGSDAGVAPQTATEEQANGSTLSASFGENDITINGQLYPQNVGSQDRASVLLQLTGMGLAEPEQIQDVIEIYVAGALAPEVQKFQVMGDDEIATPLGTITARHLVQLVRVGAPRLEVWLAPARHWLPVQLRATAPDGTVSTQTITRIEER